MSKHTRNMPRWLRRRVMEDHGYTCYLCGRKSYIGLTIDHVKPVSAGGDGYDPTNLRPACHSCNAKKGARVA